MSFKSELPSFSEFKFTLTVISFVTTRLQIERLTVSREFGVLHLEGTFNELCCPQITPISFVYNAQG